MSRTPLGSRRRARAPFACLAAVCALLPFMALKHPGIASAAGIRNPFVAPVAPAPERAPAWALRPGERYFRVGGQAAFVLGRNPTEVSVKAFERDFDSMAAAGESLVRVHLMHGIPPRGAAGQVDEEWAKQWDRVFDAAARRGIGVIPVFTIWAQWNDGSNHELWHVWQDNPYNAARGGPARSPAEILSDSACRRMWLGWLSALVKRWQNRPNIAAWEPISEIDLVTGASPRTAGEFAGRAAETVRAADPRRRPITISLSGLVDWPQVFGSPAVDIVQAHPYAEDARYSGRLSDMLLDAVRDRLRRYGKPVLVGECGLDARPPGGTLTLADRAYVGVRQAIWASIVSGALAGRMLWWEDGYDKYEHAAVGGRYQEVAKPAERFLRGIRFAGLRPVAITPSAEIRGAAVASDRVVVGWFRDSRCVPPAWPVAEIAGATVMVSVPARARKWRIEFYSTETGRRTGALDLKATDGILRVPLQTFRESVAFVAR